ncbi:PPE domain-containing protein [Nocardia sp. NPDC051787]|uniref:PPE domain-containing protein n=1 Tax=Nocardia sp. NPDC051787 TaxID=3155415 RepID=UPI00341226D2
MIEPPGFTGVVWAARPPERLAQDFATGPGPVPMAEAGVAWGRLAAGFGTAVVEYEQILDVLRAGWESEGASAVLERISALRDWLSDTAGSAAANAVHAESQAAAYEVARLAMPDSAEVAAIQAIQRAAESAGDAVGLPLRAAAADADSQADIAKAAAARVMRGYEGATEPLAQPWTQAPPPQIATGTALAAEQAESQPAMPSAAAGTRGIAMPVVPVTMPRATYHTPVHRQVTIDTRTDVIESVSAKPSTPIPMAPAAMSPGTTSPEEEHRPRAGLAGHGDSDPAALDPGIRAAPAVLGASEPQRVPDTAPARGSEVSR